MTLLHLVGHDGSPHGDDALALARAIGTGRDVRRVLVHVLPGTAPTEVAGEAWIRALETAAGERVERMRGTLADDEVLDVVTAVSPARGLHDLAEGWSAELVVVGEGRGPVNPLHLPVGSVTSSLLCGGPCAVAHAPAGYARNAHQMARLVVGFDGSDESRDALIVAAELAGALEAVVDVVYAYDHTGFPRFPGTVAEAEVAAERLAAEGLAMMPEAVRGLSASRSGTPGAVIAACADDQRADMIVMGSRGYGPIRRTLLGSTGSRVLHQARRPVLLLPRGPRQSALGGDSAGVAPARSTIDHEAAVR